MFGLTLADMLKASITGVCTGFGSAIGTYFAVKHALKIYERNHKKVRRLFKRGAKR